MKLHHLLAAALLAAPGHAGSCGSAAKAVLDTFKEYKAKVDERCRNKRGPKCRGERLFTGLMNTMGRWFDTRVSKNQWATIGPRRLTFARQKGTLVGTSGRLFLTALPMFDKKVTLTLKKTYGKGKTGIVENSAEAFLRMWERTHEARRGPVSEVAYKSGWLGQAAKGKGVRRPAPTSRTMTRPKRSGTMTRPRR